MHLEVFRGFSSSPLLPLKHFAARQRHAGPHRPENPQESLGKTPSPTRGRRDITRIHLIVIGIASLIDVHQSLQINLITAFAAQATIALESTRREPHILELRPNWQFITVNAADSQPGSVF